MAERDEFEKFTANLKAEAKTLGFKSVTVGVSHFNDILGAVIEFNRDLFDRKKLTDEQIVEFVNLFKPDLLKFLSEEFGLPPENKFESSKSGVTYWSFHKKDVYPRVSSGVIDYDFDKLKVGLIFVGNMVGRQSRDVYAPHFLGGTETPNKQLAALQNYVSTRFGILKEAESFLDKGWKTTEIK